jgi:hypothetical protein
MRAGWIYDGKHFAETTTPLGGHRHFIDGKPTKKAEWFAAYKAAKAADHKAQQADPDLKAQALKRSAARLFGAGDLAAIR